MLQQGYSKGVQGGGRGKQDGHPLKSAVLGQSRTGPGPVGVGTKDVLFVVLVESPPHVEANRSAWLAGAGLGRKERKCTLEDFVIESRVCDPHTILIVSNISS